MSSVTFKEPKEYLVAALVSQIAGVLSLAVWLFAQLPQILENYLNQSVSGVSLAFLACWIGGDVTNFLGCILTGALPFQTCLASYYCFIDLILSLQFWYYTRVYPRQKVHHNMLQSPNMMRPVTSAESVSSRSIPRLNRFDSSAHHSRLLRSHSVSSSMNAPDGIFLRLLAGSVLSSSFKGAKAMPVDLKDTSESLLSLKSFQALLAPVQLVAATFVAPGDEKALIGTICGWCSTLLYISSRSPQIWKNYCLKSTHGVSPYLFLFAMLGNSLYTISILSDLYLLSKYEKYLGDVDFHTVFRSQLPFLVGSSGTVFFDCILLIQFYVYGLQSSIGHKSRSNSHPEIRHRSHSRKSQRRVSPSAHFTKPDWYTYLNNGQDRMGIYEEFNEDAQSETRFDESRKSSFLYYKNAAYVPSNESTSLLQNSISSPPLHYVMSSSHIENSYQQKNRKGFAGAFSSLAKSFSQNLFIRSASIGSSHQSISASPVRDTSLIPSLVGTYSSLSKRMMDENKIPFLPIDFLQSDFLHRESDLDSNH